MRSDSPRRHRASTAPADGKLDRLLVMTLGISLVYQRPAAREQRQAGAVWQPLHPRLKAVEVIAHLVQALGSPSSLDRVGHAEHDDGIRFRFCSDRLDGDEQPLKCLRRSAEAELEDPERPGDAALEQATATARKQCMQLRDVRLCLALVAADSVHRSEIGQCTPPEPAATPSPGQPWAARRRC